MNPKRLVGGWSMAGMELDIVELHDGLAISSPEAPEGFESGFEPTGSSEYVIRGGQFDGARVSFVVDDGGSLTGMVGGTPLLTPLDRPAAPPPGSGLEAPRFGVGREIEARYRTLLDELRSVADGRSIDEVLPSPPTPFVQWAMKQDAFIFHGSNHGDIDEFRPVRNSMEIGDTGGRGNLGAVYGTHDGLWSMFFAIVDRQRLHGSIRNGVTRYESTDRAIDLYHFSIHHELLAAAPYTTGTLYLMPRHAFERIPFYPGGPMSNEWASHDPVRPIARLTIEPEDFPFLDRIGGHDDGPLLRFGELGDEIYGRLVSARRTESGFDIVTTAGSALVAQFIEMSSEFYPDVSRTAIETDDGILISMSGPPAFLDAMGRKLGPHLA